jgi:hypothetical protein
MDDVKRAADEYNKIGERSAKAGIQQGLHNEEFECTTVDGKRTYDVLLELLDPRLVTQHDFAGANARKVDRR